MQYIKQIMLLVILTISWKCQAEEVKEICYGGYGKFSNKPDRKYITLLSFIQ